MRMKKSANLSIDEKVIAEARAYDINISRAAEEGIARAVKAERERRWRDENAEAVESWNRYIEENGLPLAQYRRF
jgi:antitoxin CcdA